MPERIGRLGHKMAGSQTHMRAQATDDPAALLARGETVPVSLPRAMSGPEWLCRRFVTLALASIPVWLGLPSPLLWIASGAGVWALLRWMLKSDTPA
jgi:hypothetical protein